MGPCSLVCEVGAAGFLSELLCTQPGPAPARVLIGLQWIEHCGLFVASRPSRCGPGCLCLCGQCVPWALLEGNVPLCCPPAEPCCDMLSECPSLGEGQRLERVKSREGGGHRDARLPRLLLLSRQGLDSGGLTAPVRWVSAFHALGSQGFTPVFPACPVMFSMCP